MPKRRHLLKLVINSFITCSLTLPASAVPQKPDLAALSLEELSQLQVRVSSVSRKDEILWLTPAAVYVISRAEILHSTATSIPELLRVVPGLQVAQINASSWAVTARGFNSEYASKLLVLIDGRTVYSEIYSGAHWDQVDLPLEMIERIEVIRGPGAAVWGTNAVNGVINIIKRKAVDTPQPVLSGHVSRIDDVATIAYSSPVGERANYRGYVRYIDRKPFDLASGAQAFDGAGTWRSGARADFQKNAENWFTAGGDIYDGHLRTQTGAGTAAAGSGQEYDSMSGGYLLSRWEHKSEGSDTALQVYYDQQSRMELAQPTRTRTTDFDYQSHYVAGVHQDLVWGSEFRFTADHVDGAHVLAGQTDFRNYLINGFLQDEITLSPHRLILTAGTKLQTGTLAGFQAQPSVRLLFAPDERDSIWAAVSRAAAAPSIQDKYVRFPLVLGAAKGLEVDGLLLGTPAFKPETVVAYEAGYRRKIANNLTVDLASFYNVNLRIPTIEADGVAFVPAPSPHLFTTIHYRNGYRAKSGGVEAAVTWKPRHGLDLHGSYAWMEAQIKQVTPGIVGILNAFNTPRNAYSGTAAWSIARDWRADALVSRVGSMPTNPSPSLDPSQPRIIGVVPAYTRMDFNMTRKFGNSLRLSAGGTNLQSPRHLEFDAGSGYITPAYVPRSLLLKGTWTF